MKRFLSAFISGIMILSLLPASAASNTETTENVSKGVKAPVFNASNYNDSGLFKKYIRSTYGGKLSPKSLTLSSGALFKLVGRHNSAYGYSCGFNENQDSMSMLWNTKFYRCNRGERWEANFKFKMATEENDQNSYKTFKEMLNSGQIQMKFGGNFANYGNSRPSMKFGSNGIEGSSIPNNATVEKDSGWFNVSYSDLMNTELKMSGGGNGSEAYINHPWAMFADLTKPTVKSASIEEGVLSLDMGEPLRVIGNISDMKLKLRATNLQTGIQNIELTATAMSITNGKQNSIDFKIDDNGLNEYQVTRIEGFEVSGKEYKGQMYGISLADNYLFSTYYGIPEYKKINNEPGLIPEYFTASTPVTDIAGNNLEISRKDLTSFNLINDMVPPKAVSAEISGSMISDDNTRISQDSSWPEDIDRSSVFAGVGDSITFSLMTDEIIKVNDDSEIYIDLNIKDKDGKPIRLSYDKTEDVYDGVNNRKATKITFKPLTITADMRSDNINDPIAPIKLEARDVWDLYQNEMDKSANIDFKPKQQIYFDNTAPTVSIDGDITADENKGEFVIPIKINDGEGTVSGFVGLDADFAWVYDGDKQISYKYAISTSPSSTPAESDYKTAVLNNASNPAWNKFETPQSEYYIHIKTDATELKGTRLMLKSNDWAGNSGTSEQPLDKISIDKVAPVISLISMNTEYGDGSATIKAKVKVTDYNTDGLVAKYQLVDKDAKADEAKWEGANITDGVFDFSQVFSSSEKFEKDLLVYATDKNGNESDVSRYSVVADLTKAKAKYEIKSDLSQLNSLPEIIVSAPDNPDSRSNADTRVTLKMGDTYYTKVYNLNSAQGGVNIFDFSGQSGWYEVSYNQDGTVFQSVTEVDDMTKLSGFYGEVSVEFESAFSDLAPAIEKALIPSDSEERVSYQKEGGFKVLYAPLTDKLYDIKFDDSFKTDKGEALTASGGGSDKHITRLKTMSDIRLSFSLSNNKVPAWGVNNIDFEKSRIEVTNSNNNTVYTASLSRSESQIFAMPDRDNDGKLLETDAYKITVYLYQTGSDSPQTFSYDTAVVLDNLTPSSNTGATKSEILTDRFFDSYAVGSPYITPIEKTSDIPMTTINIGTADKAEIFRSESDAYSINSFGMLYAKITLTTDNVSKELCGETIGQVSGFRVWNKLTTGGEELPFKADSDNPYSYTYDVEVVDEASLKNAKADGNIKIVKGTNTICYQVKLDNGNLSPVYEFTVNTVDSLPQASLNMKINESKNYEDGSSIHALSADAKLENVFSPNGEVKVYYLYQGGESNNFSSWSCREISADEETKATINLIGDSGKKYQSYTDANETEFKNTMYAFCIVDECGNSIIIFPQFKDGTKYTFEKETLSSAPYSLNTYNTSEYIYQVKKQYTDLDKSTIIINDSGEELPLKNPPMPNKYGYMGASGSGSDLMLYFTKPWDDKKAASGEDFVYKLKVKRVGIHGDTVIEERSVDGENMTQIDGLKYVAPGYTIYSADEKGTSIAFNGNIKLKGEDSYLDGSIRKYPIFSDGTYNFEVTDMLGKTHTVPVTVDKWGSGPNVTVTPLEKTRGDVTLIAQSNDYNITLTEKDGGSAAAISGNDSKNVTAVIKQPTELIMKWNDGSVEKSRTMIIDNNEVKPISPKIVWDYNENDVTDGCVYESVTATLVDENGSTLIDPITGGAPSHTFYPNEETMYTFKPQSYTNQYGDMASEEVTAELGVKVIDYPAPAEWKDTTAPSVGIVGYVVRGDAAHSKNLVLSLYDAEKQSANPALPEYTYTDSGTEKAYEKVGSPEIFLQKMGWASKYRFNVNIGDESAVKLILKNGAPASAPDYNSASDTIDGISLNGRAIDVWKNASFTVYAVDSFGNTTSVYMNIDNVGNAPVPHLEKVVSGDSQKIKVYLVPPADGGLSDLMITNEEACRETEDGDYKGLYYIELNDNAKDLVVKYSCKYNGEDLTGQLSTSVTEIDKSNPKKIEEKWSENAKSNKTNKDVTVQIRFDKTITDAKFKEASPTAEVFRLDNQVTVSYSENSPGLTLECTAVNGQKCEVTLNAVENIDKVKPNITVTKTELSKYKRKATITLTADETVTFLEGGTSGTEFKREVSANGEYTYNFTDLAGNKTEVKVNISDIITGDLSLMFSLKPDGSNSQPTPDKLGALKVGDKVYVRPNRECTITFGQNITAKASEWTELTVTEDKAGLYPTLKAADTYGNTKYYHFLQIALPDKTPPTIKLKAETIDVSLSLSEDEIKSKLTENAIVSDDTSKSDKISLSFVYEKPKAAATVNVTYKAEDEAKNTSQRTGKIHFYQNNELLVKVNGVSTYRDMVVISGKEKQNITISSGGEPYSVYVKNGIKTVGQMKIGSTKLAYNKTDDEAASFTPDKEGYYTFLVKTQGQGSYRFVIYVK